MGQSYQVWLIELREGDVSTRVRAARWLAEAPPLPAEVAGTLLEALFDEASEHEDWTDWNGAVVGGEDHHVWWYALGALGKMGAAGLRALLEAARKRPSFFGLHLARLGSLAVPDVLLELGAAGRSALRTALEEAELDAEWGAKRQAALAHLAWIEAEAAGGADRVAALVARLTHPQAEAQRLAVAELGGLADPAARPGAAAVLADALLRREPELQYTALVEAGPALGRLGPVLDPARVRALVQACLAGRLFHVWGSLLAVLPGYGEPARELAPMLEAWAADGKAPRQIGVDYHREVRNAARHGLAKLRALAGAGG